MQGEARWGLQGPPPCRAAGAQRMRRRRAALQRHALQRGPGTQSRLAPAASPLPHAALPPRLLQLKTPPLRLLRAPLSLGVRPSRCQ